ncbi:glycosyltransferase family 25 protein [Polynucleobacter sp. AP-Titi-500A-B4]|uniref:glycosyltransferase family 25 protein n=1 Tax=Polynucleobacter sp. AP-Titi-500A-B4 TaxID=2576923 RepID=UPI001BFD1731|nr:glycosyltransferase family 25 protein [Polynucleobacter sp. AP-Titi-500A-B4]QWE12811.1 glycosyltransferase family 25 protein [Polynucleobacter sp. AP-Titi-500A-B4]
MFPVPTIVISLKRAQNRRKNAERELLDQGADWEILDAIDGLKLQNTPPEYNEKKVSRLLGFPLTLSEIGCFLSHREAWLNCIEKDQTVLILEDDFVLAPSIKEAISYLLENQACWDVARLQGLTKTSHTVITASDNFQIVANKDDPLGATAYLLKPYSAKKLLVDSHEIYEPLDHFLEHHKKHGLRMVAIKPYPVSTNGSESTIFDRPDRKSISGSKKMMRSICRAFDRLFNPYPWFPK